MNDGLLFKETLQAFSLLRRLGCVLVLFLAAACPSSCFAQAIQLFSLSGPGITQDATCPGQFQYCYTMNLGNVDALGVNTSAAFTEIASTSPYGELYFSNSYANVRVGAQYNGQPLTISATVTTPFAHPSLINGKACSSGCGAASGFSSLTTTATTLFNGIEGPALLLNVGAFVAELNGTSAYTGGDTEVITFLAQSGNHTGQVRLTINITQVQTAIVASLSGFTTGTSTDYLYNFGNVNGLGVGSALAHQSCTAALCPAAALPATVYYSPQYIFTARFADFATSSGTLKAALSTNFATAAQGTLQLCDAAASLGTCNAFPVTLTTALATRGTVSRYLGLTVAEKNGTGAFTGSASAVVTFTFTVP